MQRSCSTVIFYDLYMPYQCYRNFHPIELCLLFLQLSSQRNFWTRIPLSWRSMAWLSLPVQSKKTSCACCFVTTTSQHCTNTRSVSRRFGIPVWDLSISNPKPQFFQGKSCYFNFRYSSIKPVYFSMKSSVNTCFRVAQCLMVCKHVCLTNRLRAQAYSAILKM